MKNLFTAYSKDCAESTICTNIDFFNQINHLYRYLVFLMLFIISIFALDAQPVVSNDSLSSFEIEARVRNGNTGFEGILFTPSTPVPGESGGIQWQMNPTGAPVWNNYGNLYGNIHSFRLTYEKATGKTIWNIDFNHDGDFSDSQESVFNIDSSLAGKGFQYVNLWAQGSNSGLAAEVIDFTINGHQMGSFASGSDTAASILFSETHGYFGDIDITGQFSFSGNGGQERPRVWVRLGKVESATVEVVNQGQVSVPALSNQYLAVLLVLVLVIGGCYLSYNMTREIDLS